MSLPDAAVAHDQQMRRITASTLLTARRLWGRLGAGDWDEAWRTLGPQMLALLVASQVAAGRESDGYVAAAVAELGLPDTQDGQVSARGLAGVASDGRPLASLLYEPVIAARAAGAAGGLTTADALAFGRASLDRIVTTQVADAARAAESVATVSRPAITGYVRMVSAPCCSRCAILAGRHYRWNEGFQRHPKCDCRHIPASEDVAGDLTTDPRKLIESGQVGRYVTDPKTGEERFVHGLSKDDRKAIVEDGADPAQVINAHRGMSTAQVFGRNVKITSEGTTARGLAGQRLGRLQREDAGLATRITRSGPELRRVTQQRSQVPRLRPESIYKIAGNDRAEALRLLRRFGYLI